jgi:colanic acid/amylovoran biosynthesis glycosyltransferase
MKKKMLSILPGLKAAVDDRGFVLLTRKFVDGIQSMQRRWGGPVQVFIEPTKDAGGNLDDVWIDPQSVGFSIFVVSYDGLRADMHFAKSAVVLGSLGYRQNELSKFCRSRGIPCVYVSELTLKTRLQIVASTAPSSPIKWRRFLWEFNQERRNKKALRLASGVQCNGTPSYEAYKNIAPNALLFFDTRLTSQDLANSQDVQKRVDRITSSQPLQLVFSGRLVSIKGVDHLLEVALQLKRSGIDYRLTICGDGPMRPTLEKFVDEKGLGDLVRFLGVLDFSTELLPLLSHTVDLFVCCHTQGDPSCTYLETLGCGVPIVGYANEALAGIATLTKAVFVSKENDPAALARTIAVLNMHRNRLVVATQASLEFAKHRIFEIEFERRIEHLKALAANN